MEDDEKRDLRIAAIRKWMESAPIAPGVFTEFIENLCAQGKISLADALELIHEYTTRKQ